MFFKNNAYGIFWLKSISKLLQSVLVCPPLVSPSSRYDAVSLPLYNITLFFAWADFVHQMLSQFFEASTQCYRREPPN